MSLSNCHLVDFGQIRDARGNLSVIQRGTIPFEIARIYYLYDVPGGLSRGAHAHRELQQLIIALSGSFTVRLDDGFRRTEYILSVPFQGLYICPYVWRELHYFSSGAVCLSLASEEYDEHDYIREYDTFLEEVRNR